MKFWKNKLLVPMLAWALLLSAPACGANKTPAAEGPFASMKTVDLQGGNVDSSVFAKKRLTLVNAWNLDCTACIQELPALERLNRELAQQGVAVLGLYYPSKATPSDPDRADIENILSRAEVTYPQLLVSEAMLESAALSAVSVFPTTFFVDANGAILDTVTGSADYDGWVKRVESALAPPEEPDISNP